jgi:hypothetical protein
MPSNFVMYYKGALSAYRYANYQIGNLLDFLSQAKQPDKIWIADNLEWGITVDDVPKDYDTYIFGFFGEFVHTDFLEKINHCLPNKKLILLSSTDCGNFELSNFKKFYIEHLHHYARFYPKTPYRPLAARSHQHSIMVGRLAVHKIIALAKLKLLYPDLLYSYQKLSSTEISESDFFLRYKTIHNIDLSDALKQQIQQLFHNPPVSFDSNHSDKSLTYGWEPDLPAYTDSQFHWCAESIYLTLQNFPRSYLTEKSIKPLATGTPFVVLGQKGSHTRLSRMGFQPYLDYRVLDNLDDNARLLDIIDSVNYLDLDLLQSDVDFNYNWFHNHFFDHVEQNINAETKQAVLDYINLCNKLLMNGAVRLRTMLEQTFVSIPCASAWRCWAGPYPLAVV